MLGPCWLKSVWEKETSWNHTDSFHQKVKPLGKSSCAFLPPSLLSRDPQQEQGCSAIRAKTPTFFHWPSWTFSWTPSPRNELWQSFEVLCGHNTRSRARPLSSTDGPRNNRRRKDPRRESLVSFPLEEADHNYLELTHPFTRSLRRSLHPANQAWLSISFILLQSY